MNLVLAFSFNGEPQAEAKSGAGACGLPLNDEVNDPLVVVSLKSLRLTRGRKARRSLLLAFRPRVKQDKTLSPRRSHLSETRH